MTETIDTIVRVFAEQMAAKDARIEELVHELADETLSNEHWIEGYHEARARIRELEDLNAGLRASRADQSDWLNERVRLLEEENERLRVEAIEPEIARACAWLRTHTDDEIEAAVNGGPFPISGGPRANAIPVIKFLRDELGVSLRAAKHGYDRWRDAERVLDAMAAVAAEGREECE